MVSNNRHIRRRNFIKVGGSAGLVALAGCGGDGGGEGSDPDDSTQSPPDEVAGGTTQSSGSGTTVTWWHAMSGSLGQVVDGLVSDFNDQSDDVVVETQYQGEYSEILSSVIAAVREGNQPDIAQISVSDTRFAMDSGAFASIQNVMGDRVDFDDYVAPVAQGMSIDGEIRALPFNNSNPIIYINGDMLADAGYDSDALPTTFDEVLDICRTVVEDGYADYGISFSNDPWYINQWYGTMDQPMVNNQNGHGADPPTEMQLVNDAGFELYNWWRTLDEEGLWLNPGKRNSPGDEEAFHSENVAMIISSTAGLAETSEAADFELKTSYHPAPEGTWTGVSPGGAGLQMAAELSDEKQNAAIEFLTWLSETDQQVRWHQETGYFPATNSAISELESGDWFDENPNFRTAVDQLQDTEITPASRGYLVGPSLEMESHLIDFTSRILTTDRDLEVLLEDAETQGESILQDYNRAQ